MEHEGSLSCSLGLFTRSHSEPHESMSTFHSVSVTIHFHIFLPYICLHLPSSFFRFSTETLYSHLCCVFCIHYQSVLDLIILIFGEYKLCGYLMHFPLAFCCFIPLGANILSILVLFSNTLTPCSSLHMRPAFTPT